MKLAVEKGKVGKVEFKVTEETTRRTEYHLVEGIGGDEIVFLLQRKLIDDKTRSFLEQITSLRSQTADLKRKLEDLQNEQKTIFSDQDRLRRNLQSLGQTEDERNLRSRVVKQLNQQEDRLEAINKSVKDLQAQLTAKQEELSKLVMNYAFETR